jgi:biopolymer transport protein ExbD
MIRSSGRRREDLLINVTPMIDVMIFLIVFFLAATNFAEIEREQDIQLPEASRVGSLSRILDNKITVNVRQDGTSLVEGRKYGAAELKALVATRHARFKDALKVEIRADRRTPHGEVTRVLALVREAGVSRPMIPTKEFSFGP